MPETLVLRVNGSRSLASDPVGCNELKLNWKRIQTSGNTMFIPKEAIEVFYARYFTCQWLSQPISHRIGRPHGSTIFPRLVRCQSLSFSLICIYAEPVRQSDGATSESTFAKQPTCVLSVLCFLVRCQKIDYLLRLGVLFLDRIACAAHAR